VEDGAVRDRVVRCEADRVTVLFGDAGYRTLFLRLVREEGLLRAA